jgi:hypothetical protein
MPTGAKVSWYKERHFARMESHQASECRKSIKILNGMINQLEMAGRTVFSTSLVNKAKNELMLCRDVISKSVLNSRISRSVSQLVKEINLT